MPDVRTDVKIDQLKLAMDRLVTKLAAGLDILEALQKKVDFSWDDLVSENQVLMDLQRNILRNLENLQYDFTPF